MTCRPGMLVLVLAAAACGGGGDGQVTRRECIGFVAHRMLLEDLASIGAEDLGEAVASKRYKNEADALEAIRLYELGSRTPAEGEGERRIARCLAETSRANLRCAVRATSIAELERCPR